MKHTKREWMPLYSFLDRKRVTDHLADMAARGWMLDRLGTWSWHYRRTEPKQLRFAVTFFAGAGRFSPAPAAGLDTFQDYCAQAGWHRAASSDQVQVFYSEDPAAVPIDTDPAAELENIRRSIGKPMMRNYLALLLLCLLEVAFQCYQIWTDPVETLASPTALLAATAYLPLLVLTLASLLLYRRWQRRAEAAVEAGLPLPDLRSARGLGILVLMWSGLLIAGLFASISRSTGDGHTDHRDGIVLRTGLFSGQRRPEGSPTAAVPALGQPPGNRRNLHRHVCGRDNRSVRPHDTQCRFRLVGGPSAGGDLHRPRHDLVCLCRSHPPAGGGPGRYRL